MTVTTMILMGNPGAFFVSDIGLANVIVLNVARVNKGYNTIVTGSPGNLEAKYRSDGRIYFQDAFGGTLADDVREKVYVRYKF